MVDYHFLERQPDDWYWYLFDAYVPLLRLSSGHQYTNAAIAGSILNSTGSIGLALIYWFIGFIMAIAGFCVYLEFASYFPSRSGAEVVYLEQAYPRPKHFFPIAYAVQSVVLSFSSSNAIGSFSVVFRAVSY